jgi:parallel beta-helix repeat protein
MERPGIALAAVLCLSPFLGAATFTVDPAGGGDFAAPGPAIDAAAPGDVVVLMPGDHVISRPLTFRGKPLTVRSHSGPAATVLRMSDVPDDPDRASVVIFQDGEGPDSVLEGVTVTGGRGTRWGEEYWQGGGGGVLCLGGSAPTLAACVITGNAAERGAGVYCPRSSPTLTDCTITANGGSGVHAYESEPILSGCTVSRNRGSSVGGGIDCFRSSATLTCCAIIGNFAEEEGGGVGVWESSVAMINCVVAGNRADEQGAGIGCRYDGAVLTAIHCTVAWNHAPGTASISTAEGAADTTINCLFGENPEELRKDPCFVDEGVYDYTRFESVWIGDRVYELPDFVVEDPDFHLLPGSRPIDRGEPLAAPTTDMDGLARPCGAGFDLGAYEYGGCTVPEVAFRRGDANSDGARNIADAIATLGHLFAGGEGIPCAGAADSNDDGALDVADAIALLGHLFAETGPLPDPFAECGADGTPDALGCSAFPACAP